jgi:diaminopimelate decarboxylase
MMNPDVVRYPAEKIRDASERIPTPFFLYEEDRIRHNCRRLVAAFAPRFKNFQPLYALKANPNPHVASIVVSEGFGIDCSSPSEALLTRALKARGMHTGNYTGREELELVLKTPGLQLNLDDISLVPIVQKIGVPEFLSFRINPGITKGGMESLLLAGPDAKFGVPWEAAVHAYRRAKEIGVRRFGIHMMTGSNVLEACYFALIAAKLLEVAGNVKKALGIDFECLNIGGGFGVPYLPEERTLNLEQVASGVRAAFDDECRKWGLREPALMVEPGRLILADAGFLVTRVQVIKEGYKWFVGVDAGMNDLPRPSIYGAYHHISVLGKTSDSNAETPVNVVGRLCENNDQFAKDRILPPIHIGDFLIIHNAGAHSYAMGHNYNGRPRSAEYLLESKGNLRQIRRAETAEDLLRTVVGWHVPG